MTAFKPKYGIPATSNQGRFGYTGQLYLKEIEFYYYKARIYNPKLGRFLQTDPVGYEDQMNLYAYVGNDPVNMVDPTGETGKGQRGDGETGAALAQLIIDIITNPDDYIPKRIDGNSNLQNNKENGKGFEQHVKNKVENGVPSNVTVSEQVTIKPDTGGNTVMDLVVSDGENIVCIECKSSSTAPLTKNHKSAHPQIVVSGGTVQGKGKPAIPGGTEIRKSPVIVVRPKIRGKF